MNMSEIDITDNTKIRINVMIRAMPFWFARLMRYLHSKKLR